MILSGKARLAGILGWPVSHSRSPRLHGFWLDRYGVDGAYLPLPVAPEDLEAVVRAMPRMGFAGANCTIPHKEAVMSLCDDLDPAARAIGAVNTLVFEADGRVRGSNTDAFGFIAHLRASVPQWSAGRGPAVVLGAGGAARGVVHALAEAGVPEVRIVNRSVGRAEAVARDLGGGPARLIPAAWDELPRLLTDAALLVNTTSLGMTGHPPLPLDLSGLPPDAVVDDIVYVPLETDLLRAARARGNPVVDGLGMLLHQARPGFHAWFGVDPEVDEGLATFVRDGLT